MRRALGFCAPVVRDVVWTSLSRFADDLADVAVFSYGSAMLVFFAIGGLLESPLRHFW